MSCTQTQPPIVRTLKQARHKRRVDVLHKTTTAFAAGDGGDAGACAAQHETLAADGLTQISIPKPVLIFLSTTEREFARAVLALIGGDENFVHSSLATIGPLMRKLQSTRVFRGPQLTKCGRCVATLQHLINLAARVEFAIDTDADTGIAANVAQRRTGYRLPGIGCGLRDGR